jgi:hypothetical protein|tara:strand:- start:8 stop:574 length:567 start_codon:yes stop_codon:yes gene_type:complete
MATVYEIVQGLSQAAANAYDGALTEDGEALKIGLKREEGDPLLDKRVMDGFGVKFYGNMMCLSYQSEVQLKEVYANGFESDVESQISEIVSFLKKEYKSITGNSVSLTAEGEVDVRVENSSRVRSWVTAKMHYKVGGLDKDMADEPADIDTKPEAKWQTFVSQGGWDGKGGKRPENDTRKKDPEAPSK